MTVIKTPLKNFYEENLKIISGIKFTQRQVDVLACLISGWDTQSIGKRLSISPNTVESHLDGIAQKLGSGGRNKITAFVEQSGKEKDFRKYYQLLFPQEGSHEEPHLLDSFQTPLKKSPKKERKKVWHKKFILRIISPLFLFLGMGYLILQHFFFNAQETPPRVSSDMTLPHYSFLLERQDLLKKIHDTLETSEDIKILVLTGVGGAGKTTLARQYARSQTVPVIWEINAESKTSLMTSFEDLAYALARTKEEESDIHTLRQMSNFSKREKQIFLIVKKLLKAQKKWILIYDNVDSFDDIEKYLPNNADVWGKGDVILTTRDANIKNYSFLKADSIVPVGPLTPEQQQHLFKRIFFKGSAPKQTRHDEQALTSFLEKIPPFSLDVVTAAHYIRYAHIDYQTYLKRMQTHQLDFHHSQKKMREEFSDYTQTRYSIVSMSLQRILDEDPSFRELLILLSLLDSQNIPIDLLKKVKSDLNVEKFIHCLRKYSFITKEGVIGKTLTISLHRSVQRILCSYLHSMQDSLLQKDTQKVSLFFNRYLDKMIEERNVHKLIQMSDHVKSAIESKIISEEEGAIYKVKLGWILYHLGYYIASASLIESGLAKIHSQMYEHTRTLYQMRLGVVLLDLGHYKKARSLLMQSVKNFEEKFPKDSLGLARSLTGLAVLESILGHDDNARVLAETNLKIRKAIFGENHFLTVWALGLLGNIESHLGHYDKGARMLEKEILIQENQFGSEDVIIAWPLQKLGVIYSKMKNYDQAESLLKRSLKINESYYGQGHPKVSDVLHDLGALYFYSHKHQKALHYYSLALSLYQKNNHPGIYRCFESLGNLYGKKSLLESSKIKKEDLKKIAKDYYQKAIKIVYQYFPKDSPHTIRLEGKIKRLEKHL